MHEMSIMTSVLRRVEAKLAEVGGRRVRTIRVAVGLLSGVEPGLLESAFEFLSPGTVAEGAQLLIRTPPVRLRCQRCGRSFEVTEFALTCRFCQGTDVEIEGGDELVIEEMEVDFDDSPGTGLREDTESQ